MFKRVVFVAVCVLALMIAIKDGRVLAKAGLKGSCSIVRMNADGSALEGCHAGKLEGMPDLRRHGCKFTSRSATVEYWSCPASVVASAGS